MARTILLSVHPPVALAILSGSKTLELRRRPIKDAVGARVLMYATMPTGAVVGEFRVRDTVAARPSAVWRKHGAKTGITRSAFMDYVGDLDLCFGLMVGETRSYGEPFRLPEGMRGPRSYAVLDPAEHRSLLLRASGAM
jgi:predicted transcriptional regulator